MKPLIAFLILASSAIGASADMICYRSGDSLVCHDTSPPAFVQPDMRDHPAGGGGMPLRSNRVVAPVIPQQPPQPDMLDHPAGGGGMPLDEGE